MLIGAAIAVLAPSVMAADGPAAAPPGPICGEHAPEASSAPATAILTGYGTGGFPVKTRSEQAQAYFDNGMQLAHAFAHKAAVAAFRRAEQLDPSCAMCAWGEAWAAGPTINFKIEPKAQTELAAIADKAAALAKDGPESERQLTAALQLRYRGKLDSGDVAFAKAMDKIARAAPADNELAIIAADAWMISALQAKGQDWNGTMRKALGLLEPALARNPKDTGAIHFYIHATEMAGDPAKALPFAERLEQLAPSASHLVHMPSHTFYWTGRYADAVSSNEDAVAIDKANVVRLKLGDDPFALVYHGHNVSFGIGAAMMDGDGEAALGLARAMKDSIAKGLLGKGDGQWASARVYFVEGRYGGQAEVAAMAEPADDLPYARAMWRYARGEAAARRGDAAAARAEAEGVQLSKADAKKLGDDSAQTLVRIARLTLEGRADMLEGRPADAARAFNEAAGLQESKLGFSRDPPSWWYPVRRSLAAAKLAAGKPGDAAKEANAVLAGWKDDPLTLLVLARAESAQGRAAEADQHMAAARRGWKGDVAAIQPAEL
jgi:hypothetical protein